MRIFSYREFNDLFPIPQEEGVVGGRGLNEKEGPGETGPFWKSECLPMADAVSLEFI